ncbi:hypothetical protein [Paenibacillus jilunlii]|nr:hypothetical protein [Paenibacillus jilunlii]
MYVGLQAISSLQADLVSAISRENSLPAVSFAAPNERRGVIFLAAKEWKESLELEKRQRSPESFP